MLLGFSGVMLLGSCAHLAGVRHGLNRGVPRRNQTVPMESLMVEGQHAIAFRLDLPVGLL